eukprot:PITA_32574
MDVKSAFLNGDLHEEIYMEQPNGFIETNSSLVCQLKKSLYGLKQVPEAWYAKMDIFLLETGFSRCHSDNTVYMKKVGKSLIILVLYVDDLILTGKRLYLTHTPLHLSFVVVLIDQFMQNPHESNWKAAKRILSYVQGYVFTLGSGYITSACKKQSVISLSSAEAEYYGAVEASKEALWLRQNLLEFAFQQQHPTKLWCDNQSAIQLCKDLVQHQRSKHIELHMHFIRKLIHDHVLEVQYCSTDDQVANIFTKDLIEAKFTKLLFMVGVQEVVTKGG